MYRKVGRGRGRQVRVTKEDELILSLFIHIIGMLIQAVVQDLWLNQRISKLSQEKVSR